LPAVDQIADCDAALKQLRADTRLGVVTRSEKGCVVTSKDGIVAVPAFPIKKLVDTTGAGDQFAAVAQSGRAEADLAMSVDAGGPKVACRPADRRD
jgi:sugar/nucleoside kinase (ribokinase family)